MRFPRGSYPVYQKEEKMNNLSVKVSGKDNYLLSGDLTSTSFPSMKLDFITTELSLEIVKSTVSDLCFVNMNLGDKVELSFEDGDFKKFEYIHSDSKYYTFLLRIRTRI